MVRELLKGLFEVLRCSYSVLCLDGFAIDLVPLNVCRRASHGVDELATEIAALPVIFSPNFRPGT